MTSSVTSVDTTNPSGPFSGPSHTTWRRQRLLRIGSNLGSPSPQIPSFDPDETSLLRANQTTASYGTLPPRQDSPVSTKQAHTFRQRRNLPDLPLNLPRASSPNSITPATPLSPNSFKGIPNSYFRISGQRPISAYDAPLVQQVDDNEDDLHARTNGIRVWYSSFSSIDWLHDAIKDSVRFSRLRRGKSLRSKVRLLVDKSIGWIVVTLVGFFTAIVAFLIIRSEQWFFDLKEGYCGTGWTKAKRFCCPVQADGAETFYMGAVEDTCTAWKTWAEVLGASEHGDHVVGYRAELVQYVSYAFIAVCPNFAYACLPKLTAKPLVILGICFVCADDIPDSVNVLCNA